MNTAVYDVTGKNLRVRDGVGKNLISNDEYDCIATTYRTHRDTERNAKRTRSANRKEYAVCYHGRYTTEEND